MSKLHYLKARGTLVAIALGVVLSCSKDNDPEPVITTESTNTFTVADIPEATYEGATNVVTVKSQTEIQTLSDGEALGEPKVVTQPWSVEYSIDEGVTYSATAPEWVKITRNESDGNATVVIQPQTAVTTEKGPSWAAEKGTEESPYNLSNATGSATVENTANCYIVNGPGWYKLPLVYGNAIKGGAPNTKAFTSANGTFVNHLDKPITDPYIANNNDCAPSSALIVWQDADKPQEADKEVVTSLSLCDNNTFVKFRVTPESINYDNAVVAVTDINGTIMWSWHIWVTPYKLGDGDFSHTSDSKKEGDGVLRTFMALNLGYIPKDVTTTTVGYPSRSCKAKFTMTDPESGKSETVIKDIIQRSFNEEPVTKSFSTEKHIYYQWGRKDPLRSNSPVEACPIRYGASIKAPATFYTSEYGLPILNYCYDTWHSGIPINGVDITKGDCKTIYDPSPVGYCVPNSYAFCGLTVDNEKSPFPASGYIKGADGQLDKKGLCGQYWASSIDEQQGYQLIFDESGVKLRSESLNYTSCGASVRAVKEDIGNPDKSNINVTGYDKGDSDRNPELS